jgi:DNA-binding GntR family transcriptional regulator
MIQANSVLPEAIADSLRSSILDQHDPPGATITESSVALRYGVARPTARIAIERLVAEGLLRREAHRAARVPELDRDDIVDLFDSRAAVESAAVHALARGGTIPAAALSAHRALLERARSDSTFAEQDIAFHRELLAGAPSIRLARMHALLMGEVELCIGQVQAHQLITAGEVAAQHQGILDAVTAGEAETAARLTHEHIAGARDRLLAHYDSRHSSKEEPSPW